MKVKYSQIKPTNWKCGEIVVDSNNNQYVIEDAGEGEASLRKLEPDERNKPDFITGSVSL